MQAVTPRDYHCVRSPDGLWHLAQNQSVTYPAWHPGCNTSCGFWASLKQGYERRRPTCIACIREMDLYELTHGY